MNGKKISLIVSAQNFNEDFNINHQDTSTAISPKEGTKTGKNVTNPQISKLGC